MRAKSGNVLVLLDFSMAFYNVNHNKLLRKLNHNVALFL